MSVRVLVADDHFVARRALRTFITTQRQDWEICAEATDGAEAVERVKALHPDVAVLDLAMGGLTGAAVAEQISHESPNTIVLTTSMYDARPLLLRLQSIGVRGFIPKSRLGTDLIPAIEAVLNGQTWFKPSDMH
jgi:DNA-binding NarL/FixJ family response regulator